MLGGFVVELEIEMPQYRYVAQAGKWFDAKPIAAALKPHEDLHDFGIGFRCNQ
jgi:hypothetical protein